MSRSSVGVTYNQENIARVTKYVELVFWGEILRRFMREKSSLEPQLENNTHAPTPLHPVFCGSLRAYGLSGLKTLQLVRMQFDRKQNQIGE